jgi:hypothetical protein
VSGDDREAGLAFGRARAEAAIAGFTAEPPAAVVAEAGPAPWSPQWHAEQLADRLVAEDAVAERQRRRREQDQVKTEVTSMPGTAPGPDERRAWALRACSEGYTEVIASPDISPPAADFVWRMPDGQVRVARSAAPVTVVITPANADQVEAQFARRQHDIEDLRLLTHYGVQECLAAGIVTAADAGRLAPPKPHGRDLTRTVA